MKNHHFFLGFIFSSRRGHFWLKPTVFIVALFYLSTAYSDSLGSGHMPGAPEAYQFEDYSKSHTVNQATGDMALTLPLFTVPTPGSLEYKIQLTYAAGIQVEQQASEVGLGWNINKPVFKRTINGMPDDVLHTDADNYHYWKQMPAIYPAHIFQKQIQDLRAAKKKARSKMMGNLVKSIALSAVTFGVGSAITGTALGAKGLGAELAASAKNFDMAKTVKNAAGSYVQSSYQLNKFSATSMKSLKEQQDQTRDLIDAATTASNTMKLSGKLYKAASGLDPQRGKEDLDYHSPDSYFLSGPGYGSQLILKDIILDQEWKARFFPTQYQSDGIDISTPATLLGDQNVYNEYNLPLTTLTENNMVALINSLGGALEGYHFVDAQGNRYLFKTEIETAKAGFVEGFIPSELAESLPAGNSFSSFSWQDHYPGGMSDGPSELRVHEQNDQELRMGAAEYLLEDHVVAWGLTSIQDGNKALSGKGNEINFEYSEEIATGVDEVFTVADTAHHQAATEDDGTYYHMVDGAFSTSPSGHKSISRGFRSYKLLSKISSLTHEVVFNYIYADRYDAKEAFTPLNENVDGIPYLESIVMYAKTCAEHDSSSCAVFNRNPIAKYTFSFDHSLMYGAPDNINNNPLHNGAGCTANDLADCGRLTLTSMQYSVCDSVSGDACDSWNAMPSMKFEYAGGDTPYLDTAFCLDDVGSEDYMSWPNRCLLKDGAQFVDNASHWETQNPRYYRDATDRWGYFFFPNDENNLHNGLGLNETSGYRPDAWSLTKVEWPSGASTEFAYESDSYRYVNDFNLQQTQYGGGVRIKWLKQCDGLAQCIYDHYLYEDCEASNLGCGISSGGAQGVPPTPKNSWDFQQIEALEGLGDLPEYLVQSHHFGVLYRSVTHFQSLGEVTTAAPWGFTKTDYTSPLDTMDTAGDDNEFGTGDDEAISLAGGGKWTPDRIFHAYNWGAKNSRQSGSVGDDSQGSGGYHTYTPDNSLDGEDIWVGFDSARFIPKKGNDTYNILEFKSGGKYFVTANKPGYLFWIHPNGGRTSCNCNSNRCGYLVKLQHTSKPPFIGGPCPGYEPGETKYCGEVEFADTSYRGWYYEDGKKSGSWDCEEPGELLIFCPAENGDTPGWIRDESNSDDDYNPLLEWQLNSEVGWHDVVEAKFAHGMDNHTYWQTEVDSRVQWADTCRPIYGGAWSEADYPPSDHQSNTDWGTAEQLEFVDDAPACIDEFGVDQNDNVVAQSNGVCDLAEQDALGFSMGKKIRSYALGLPKTVTQFNSDGSEMVVFETYTYELRNYEDLENSSLYLGNTRLRSKVRLVNNQPTITTYQNTDSLSGEPQITTVASGDRSLITETIPAYTSTIEGYADAFGKYGLNMLTLAYEEKVVAGNGDWGPDRAYEKKTNYFYKQNWANDIYFSLGSSDSAQGAWLLYQTRENLSGNFNASYDQFVASYDKYLNPLVFSNEERTGDEAPEDIPPETILRYGDNETPCGEDILQTEGNYVQFSAFFNSQVTCLENALGHQTRYYYDDQYRMTAMVGPNGETTEYKYDAHGRLSAIDLPNAGGTVENDEYFQYDFYDEANGSPAYQAHYRVGENDEAGTVTHFDGNNRPIQIKVKAGDATWQVTDSYVDDRGTLAGAYETTQNTLSDELAYLGVSTLGTQHLSYTTYYDDPLKRVHQQYPLGGAAEDQKTEITYDEEMLGVNSMLKSKVTNERGHETIDYTDGFGQKALQVYDTVLGYEVEYHRDYAGKPLTVVDALGRNVMQYSYDTLGRVISQTHIDKGTTTFEYDTNNNLVKKTDARGVVAEYTYDDLNRLVEEFFNNDVTTVIPALEVKYLYDSNDDGTPCSEIEFCENGDLNNDGIVNVVDIVNLVGMILGAPYSIFCPGAEDANDDGLVNVVDIVTIVQVIMGGPSEGLQEYYSPLTSNGRLCAVQSCDEIENCDTPNYRIEYAYDLRGRAIMVNSNGSEIFHYSYDNRNNLKTITYENEVPDGDEEVPPDVIYSYDSADRLTGVQIGPNASVTFVYGATHEGAERVNSVKEIQYSNGVTQTFDYHPRGWVSNVSIGDAAANKLFTESYEYDASGNLLSIKGMDNIVMAEMTYDRRHQLETMFNINTDFYPELQTTSVSYTYDALGNRLSRIVTDGVGFGEDLWSQETNYTYIINNQLFSAADQDCYFSFDATGNLAAMSSLAGGITCKAPDGNFKLELIYDSKGRLVEGIRTLSEGNVYMKVFEYDPLGRVVKKRNAAGEILEEMFYGVSPSPERVQKGEMKYNLIYAKGQLLAKVNSETGEVHFYHQDRRTNNRLVTNESGDVVSQSASEEAGVFSMLPFGQPRGDLDDLNMYFDSGKSYDDDLMLYDFGARQYDPNLGRFVAVDPLAEQFPQWSPYVYANNNPFRYVDPTGTRASTADGFGTLTTDLLNSQMDRLNIPQENREAFMSNMMDFAFGAEFIESSHNQMAVPRKSDGTLASSAKGFYQFLDGSVPVAIQAYSNAFKAANIEAPSLGGISLNPQEWSQDQSDAMFFGHIFSKRGSDAYMRKIGAGNKDAMVKAYEIFHHTDPNAQPGTNQRAINAFQ